jgi:hypothetical protein
MHKLLMSPALLDIILGLVWLEAIAGLLAAIVIVGFVTRSIVSVFRADNTARNRERRTARVLEMGAFRNDTFRSRRF